MTEEPELLVVAAESRQMISRSFKAALHASHRTDRPFNPKSCKHTLSYTHL
jgi:hypothetical protein